jgi:hypothetical protein
MKLVFRDVRKVGAGWPTFCAARKPAAPPFAVFEGWVPKTSAVSGFSKPTDFSGRIMKIAAPFPLLRCEYESSPHRIAMNVAQLLQFFLFVQNHKIVKPLLPYVLILHSLLPQTGLLECAWCLSSRSTFRANRCFSTCMTVETLPRPGSLMRR